VEFLVVLAILLIVVAVVSAPLRREALGRRPTPDAEREVAELEAAREAKYRELRDAELDHRTGKLSDEDYAELDATLRAEAIQILRELDRSKPDEDLSAAPDGGAEALPSPQP
jgi:hypothetical protein